MGREGTVYSRWWVCRNWWLRWPRALGARGGEDDVAGGGGRWSAMVDDVPFVR
jgi:hypothetical protein